MSLLFTVDSFLYSPRVSIPQLTFLDLCSHIRLTKVNMLRVILRVNKLLFGLPPIKPSTTDLTPETYYQSNSSC